MSAITNFRPSYDWSKQQTQTRQANSQSATRCGLRARSDQPANKRARLVWTVYLPSWLLIPINHSINQIYTVSKSMIDCNLNKDYQLLIFLAGIFPTKLAIKLPFKFPPHPASVPALPVESGTSEICVEINKKVNKFHLRGSAASNSPDLSPVDYNVAVSRSCNSTRRQSGMSMKRRVEVFSRTLSTLLSTNAKSICVPVFTQTADISNIYCKQLDNWTTG